MTETNENIDNNEKIESNENKKKWTDAFKKHNTNTIDDNTQEIENSKIEQENASLKDKLLRTLAELENTRRIAVEEKEKTIKFAISNFAKDLITVMENMYLAFKSVEKVEKNGDFGVFFNGIEMTFNEFKKIFDKNNIKRIYPLNEVFNPAFHEAVAQVDSEKETGTIVEVMQAGYLLNNRVLKPAIVVVAK